MKKISVLLLLLTSCGGDFDHNVNVNGVVEVKHTFDVNDVYEYFAQQCRMMYPTASEEQIQLCATEKTNEWLNNIDNNQ